MRPLHIEIENLLGIEQADLSLRESPLVSIVGKNGAGKSSFLDSFVIALFGEPSEARGVSSGDFIRFGAKEASVALEFSVKGSEYRVERSFRKAKSVTHKASLLRKVDGSWEGVASGARDVTETIAGILSPWPSRDEGTALVNKVRNAFLSAVFVAQGKVSRILDLKPSERWTMMSAILGLDEGDLLREKARDLSAIAQKEMTDIEARIALLSSKLSDRSEEEISAELEDCLKRKETLTEALAFLRKMKDALSRLDKAEKEKSEVSCKIAELAPELDRLRRKYHVYQGARILVEFADVKRSLDKLKSEIASEEAKRQDLLGSLAEVAKKKAVETTRLGECKAALGETEDRAVHMETLSAILATMENLKRTEESLANVTEESGSVTSKVSRLERSLESALHRERLKRLEELTAGIAEKTKELKQIEGGIHKGVLDCLMPLAEGRVIDLDALSTEKVTEFARSFTKTSFGANLSSLSRLKDALADLNEEAQSLKGLADREFPEQEIAGSSKELEMELFSSRRSADGLSEKRKALTEALADKGKTLSGLKASVPPSITSSFAEEHLRDLLSEFSRTKESLRMALVTCESGLKEIASKERSLKAELEASKRTVSMLTERTGEKEERKDELRKMGQDWRNDHEELTEEARAMARDVKQFRSMSVVDPAPLESTLENFRTRESLVDEALSDLRRCVRELKDVRSPAVLSLSLQTTGSPKEAAERERVLERERDEASSKEGYLKRMLKDMRETRDEMARLKKEQAGIAPKWKAAKTLARMTDGKSFVSFALDRSMEMLLANVNRQLEATGREFALGSSGGDLSLIHI